MSDKFEGQDDRHPADRLQVFTPPYIKAAREQMKKSLRAPTKPAADTVPDLPLVQNTEPGTPDFDTGTRVRGAVGSLQEHVQKVIRIRPLLLSLLLVGIVLGVFVLGQSTQLTSKQPQKAAQAAGLVLLREWAEKQAASMATVASAAAPSASVSAQPAVSAEPPSSASSVELAPLDAGAKARVTKTKADAAPKSTATAVSTPGHEMLIPEPD